MKTKKSERRPFELTLDSQNRLLAYTTAAGLGAFLGGQEAQAEVVLSTAFTTYPHNLSKGAGTGYYKTYNYLDIDGDGKADFNLNVDTFRVNMDKAYAAETNKVLNASSAAYLIPWTTGTTLDSTTGTAPTYKKWLATSTFSGGWVYAWNHFPSSGALGFSFTAADGLTHFGYLNVQVNHTSGSNNDFTATVAGIYYNSTANEGITIGALPPAVVKVTKITVGAANAVTIRFTSSDSADASAFTLETSPVLGPSASWSPDTGAVITSLGSGEYQAVTTGAGGVSQFYRIAH